ncbi:MAG: retropepsin-like aspartic protease [Saprospiraceae bacterium]|nr:retropepsin-like aspartic protease [Saprospiraceae bacterium]
MRQLITFIALPFLLLPILASGSTSLHASFELANGFILIRATVNDQPGTYLLDSGAPGLVLNARHHTVQGEPVGLAGTGGDLQGMLVTPVHFQMDDLELTNIDALVIDLSYLERSTGQQVDGLIGLNVFAGRNIVIDYTNRQLLLTSAIPESTANTPSITLPIEMDGHIPILRIRSNGTTLRFGIDTGSRSNLICREALQYCDPYEVLNDVALTGADQRTERTSRVRVHSLSAHDVALGPTEMIISDLSRTASLLNAPLHGVLGHDFFDGCRVTINAERTMMTLTRPVTPLAFSGPIDALIALR